MRVLFDHFSSTNGETNVYLKKYIYVVVIILLIRSVITQKVAHRHKT